MGKLKEIATIFVVTAHIAIYINGIIATVAHSTSSLLGLLLII